MVVLHMNKKIVCVAMVAAAVSGVLAAQQSAWSDDLYSELSAEEFLALPAIDAEIDFAAIDYALLHAAVFYLTNLERSSRGLAPLSHSPELEAAARAHSVAMHDRGFFSHTSPVQGMRSVQDRTRAAGFAGSSVGENIARSFGIAYEAGRSVYTPPQNGGYFSYRHRGDPIPPHSYRSAAEAVVAQWMGSPGHRANILRSEYRYLGVGAAHFEDRSFYGMDTFLFTQNFGR